MRFQDLGKQMLDLNDEQLASLDISDTLKAAIVESRRINQREARRRHLQYIGKIIRQEDDPEALARAIGAFNAGSEEHTRRHHLAERWRDRMISEGDKVVGSLSIIARRQTCSTCATWFAMPARKWRNRKTPARPVNCSGPSGSGLMTQSSKANG